MLSAYSIRSGRLSLVDASDRTTEPVWFDLCEPTDDEEAVVEARLGIGVPTREEMAEIETSSRLYREDGAVFMTAMVVKGGETGSPQACPITFILTSDRFVTVRYSNPGVFTMFAGRPDLPELRSERDRIFAGLVEAIIDKAADLSELLAQHMDELSAAIFREVGGAAAAPKAKDLGAVLRKVGRSGDLNSKLRESVVTLGRLVNFMAAECRAENAALHDRLDAMAADLRSLGDHASFLAGKIEFLLEATLGFINIEQNNIMKIMSIAAVVVMPPTLVASTYGMNFRHMPELDWVLGYPAALVLMALSAILPYLYFRRRGWW